MKIKIVTERGFNPAWQESSSTKQFQEGKDDPKVKKPGTSAPVYKTPRTAVRINAVEDVDHMSNEEIRMARLSGVSKARVHKLMKQGQDYFQAKRTVIKDNFTNHMQRNQETTNQASLSTTDKKTQGSEKTTKGKEAITAQKRPVSKGNTPESLQQTKRQKIEGSSSKDAVEAVNIAVVCADYPASQMKPDELTAVQDSIMEAYDNITQQGPQVRFIKSTHKVGYLVVTCADEISAKWLRDTIPTLNPWQGASLATLDGDNIPRPSTCTVYVPDEKGQKLQPERIFNRLQVSNRSLKTSLWRVLDSSPAEKGTHWTLSINKESLEELRKLNMCPFFGMGKLKFCVKEKAKPQNTTIAKKAAESNSTTLSKEDQSSKSETSPLKVVPTPERAVPIKEESLKGENSGDTDNPSSSLE